MYICSIERWSWSIKLLQSLMFLRLPSYKVANTFTIDTTENYVCREQKQTNKQTHKTTISTATKWRELYLKRENKWQLKTSKENCVDKVQFFYKMTTGLRQVYMHLVYCASHRHRAHPRSHPSPYWQIFRSFPLTPQPPSPTNGELYSSRPD